jgi:hypothetical protein
MPLLIPIQGAQVTESRFVAHFTVDVTRELEAEPVLLSADIKSGSGVIVFVDAISSIFDAAR